MRFIILLLAFALASCKSPSGENQVSKPSSKEEEKFKVLDSKFLNKEEMMAPFKEDLASFRGSDDLKDLILEKSIPEIQQAVYDGKLTYRDLTAFYIHRIEKYDRENRKSLNSIIALNPKAMEDAYAYDLRMEELRRSEEKFNPYTLMGMPILLKDNINAAGMKTTAGAAVLKNLEPQNARIVQRLIEDGAIVLGKANLSEWAYFFCQGCPSGYSAIGGQTLNPYGRKDIDTGGSSSGSGVAVAANFAVAAVGSETAGSILSPASQNSVVGMKPSVGTLSGIGIVPISTYLDTAGPMSKNVVDNVILMRGMLNDKRMFSDLFIANLGTSTVSGRVFGVFPGYKQNPLYVKAVEEIVALGATVVELEEKRPNLDGFVSLLNVDMKKDLPAYFMGLGLSEYQGWDVQKVMQLNKADSLNYMPYGQGLFQGIVDEKSYSPAESAALKTRLTTAAQEYFDYYIQSHNLDGFLSVNNYNAAEAAVAFYPAITVPMGYNENGQPYGLTFIAPTEEEKLLYQWAAAYEKATQHRKMPKGYN
ncbi:MAG: amidase family protein [Nonlabens sp.]|uniref:amidase family protein n=1 Tax=Nonlabens sp. TaxID=1888209 RepID=UPI003EF108E3